VESTPTYFSPHFGAAEVPGDSAAERQQIEGHALTTSVRPRTFETTSGCVRYADGEDMNLIGAAIFSQPPFADICLGSCMEGE
jgi:hypothetical protein